jgi:tRNA pseudouridine55 synthase
MILLNKPVGQTPLQALDKLRLNTPELKDVKLSYAGRLDPMAEGLMLVLVGEENKDREKYLGLDKEYEVEILFGMETDTYDILGLVNLNESEKNPALLAENLQGEFADKADFLSDSLSSLIGKIKLPYPPYSSKPVDGIPLFQWARDGRLGEIEIPNQDSFINSIELLNLYKIDRSKLVKYILESIQKVVGDFRQDEILASWKKYFEDSVDSEFSVAKIKIACQSGAYMRSIAHELGRMLKTKAIALSIKRTRIGENKI